jgi:hypothetical protein
MTERFENNEDRISVEEKYLDYLKILLDQTREKIKALKKVKDDKGKSDNAKKLVVTAIYKGYLESLVDRGIVDATMRDYREVITGDIFALIDEHELNEKLLFFEAIEHLKASVENIKNGDLSEFEPDERLNELERSQLDKEDD